MKSFSITKAFKTTPPKTVINTSIKKNEFENSFFENNHKEIATMLKDSKKKITDKMFKGMGEKIPLKNVRGEIKMILTKESYPSKTMLGDIAPTSFRNASLK